MRASGSTRDTASSAPRRTASFAESSQFSIIKPTVENCLSSCAELGLNTSAFHRIMSLWEVFPFEHIRLANAERETEFDKPRSNFAEVFQPFGLR